MCVSGGGGGGGGVDYLGVQHRERKTASTHDARSSLYFVLHSSNSIGFMSVKILRALYISPWIVLDEGREKPKQQLKTFGAISMLLTLEHMRRITAKPSTPANVHGFTPSLRRHHTHAFPLLHSLLTSITQLPSTLHSLSLSLSLSHLFQCCLECL